MRCPDFEIYVQRLLDGEAPPDSAELREHRQACPACTELLGAARQLQRGLALLPRAGVPEGFAQRVVRRVLLRPRSVVSARWFLAAAASFLLVAIGFWAIRSLMQPDQRNQVVERPSSSPRPSLRQELVEAGSATLRLSRGFAREAADHASILVPPGDLLRKPSLPSAVEPDVTPLREAGRTVASGLEPVTTSAKRAWSMLVRDLPFGEPDTP